VTLSHPRATKRSQKILLKINFDFCLLVIYASPSFATFVFVEVSDMHLIAWRLHGEHVFMVSRIAPCSMLRMCSLHEKDGVDVVEIEEYIHKVRYIHMYCMGVI